MYLGQRHISVERRRVGADRHSGFDVVALTRLPSIPFRQPVQRSAVVAPPFRADLRKMSSFECDPYTA
jgi:hypothetical protein